MRVVKRWISSFSPAYAGITRRRGAFPFNRACFLRQRGDCRPTRPWSTKVPFLFADQLHRADSCSLTSEANAATWLAEAPPPTRRSTQPDLYRRDRRVGSSAHAEIDLGSISCASAISSLLRPRGDRPYCNLMIPMRYEAPPPARRSTRHQRGQPGAPVDSSAHAEIDPKRPRTGVSRGLLRKCPYFFGSPTITNGAQKRGCANSDFEGLLIIRNIDDRIFPYREGRRECSDQRADRQGRADHCRHS
jgi:hypothetical protein